MPMTKKQARALVKGVKDPEILAAWKDRLGGSDDESPPIFDEGEAGVSTVRSHREDAEAW